LENLLYIRPIFGAAGRETSSMVIWKIGKALLLIILMILVFAAGVYASDGIRKVEAWLRPDFQVILAGERQQLADPPLVYNDRTYLPIREFSEIFGLMVAWNGSDKSIILTKPEESQTPRSPSTDDSQQPGNPGQSPNPAGSDHEHPYTIDSEIQLTLLAKYVFTYQGREYPILANFYNEALYLRASDLERMGTNLSGLNISREKLTSEPYVHIEEAKKRWTELPKTDLHKGPIVTGEYDEAKLKALKDFAPFGSQVTLYAVKALQEEHTYEYLAQNSEGRFIGFRVKLYSYLQNNETKWGFGYIQSFDF
jgi:hypothetical protein